MSSPFLPPMVFIPKPVHSFDPNTNLSPSNPTCSSHTTSTTFSSEGDTTPSEQPFLFNHLRVPLFYEQFFGLINLSNTLFGGIPILSYNPFWRGPISIVGWMRILIEEKVQKNGELSRENRTIRVKKNRKRNKKSNMPSLVQKLFQTCKEVFASCEAGTVPPPEDVERLRVVLDSMKPEDVGLTVDMPFFRMIDAEGSPPITYLHIFECNKFSMGIFCLPPSGVIPLHNHPGMTVFSKLLFGSMHIKSYDWVDMPHTDKVDPSYVQPAGVRLAKVKVDSVFTAPCNTSILYPADGGNMHCFTAVTSCAVLDVLGPPYSDPEGRHCTYYRDIPYKKISGDGEIVAEDEIEQHVWLEEKEKPDEFNVVGAMYRGPKFVK